MENILVDVNNLKRVVNILGGSIKLIGQFKFEIETDRFDRRSLTRAGISFMYSDSQKARGIAR